MVGGGVEEDEAAGQVQEGEGGWHTKRGGRYPLVAYTIHVLQTTAVTEYWVIIFDDCLVFSIDGEVSNDRVDS